MLDNSHGLSTDAARQSLRISGTASCRERFVKMFGDAIGNDLDVRRALVHWLCL